MPSGERKGLTAVMIALVAIFAASAVLLAVLALQMRRIQGMSFMDMLLYTAKNQADAVIAVGRIQNGGTQVTVYGENGRPIENRSYIFEIGSITKTFTAALLSKAIAEGRIRLDDTIDSYVNLPAGAHRPTIRQLVTHAAGYRSHYLEPQMLANFFRRRNEFCGIGREQLQKRLGAIRLKERDYGFRYSNFGIAVVGRLLEEVYGRPYAELMNDFIASDLGLQHTKISDPGGNLGHYWDWEAGDAYIPAGALTSTIEDMLQYAGLQMDGGGGPLPATHEALKEIAGRAIHRRMNIHMDAIGMCWMIDRHNHILWHNGGTGHYNAYMAFDAETRTALVILANLAPGYRIPATVMGVRLLTEMRRDSEP